MIETQAQLTGPEINQMVAIGLVIGLLLVAVFISAGGTQSAEYKFCAKLNQHMDADLAWDGEGCVLREER